MSEPSGPSSSDPFEPAAPEERAPEKGDDWHPDDPEAWERAAGSAAERAARRRASASPGGSKDGSGSRSSKARRRQKHRSSMSSSTYAKLAKHLASMAPNDLDVAEAPAEAPGQAPGGDEGSPGERTPDQDEGVRRTRRAGGSGGGSGSRSGRSGGSGGSRGPGRSGGSGGSVGPVSRRASRRSRRSRKKRKSRLRRALTWASLGLGLVVVLGGAMVADAYYHAYKVYQTLQGVTPALSAARAQLAQGIVPTGDQLDVATGLAADAQAQVETAGFTFNLTGHLPFLNRPVVAARLAASAADKESNAATIIRALVLDVLGPNAAATGTVGGTPPPVFRNGVIDVGLIASLTPRLESLVANLRSADADIRAIPTIPFVKTESTLKQNALAQSAAAVTLAERALSGVRLLPSFLGADGAKTYFLALQNNADERGTGGAVLAYAMVQIDQGRIALLGAGRILDLDYKKGGINVAQPASVTWYTSVTKVAHRLANGENYTPNFPDVARTWAAQLLQRTGSPVNGVIALDPSGIASALQSERCFRVADYPSTICGTNVVSITENAQYRLPKPAQDVLAAELVQGAFATITNPSHFLSMVRNLSTALAEKHVQLWSGDAAQQALLTQLGWNGALANRGGGDYINLAYEKRIGNKVDYYAQENVTYDVTVQPSGAITSTYHLLFENLTPPNQVQDIAGQARPYGVDIAMFNLYTPKGSRFGSVTPAGDFPATVVTPSSFSDHVLPKGFLQHFEGTFHVFTQTVLAWPGHPGDLTFRYSVPGVIKRTPEGRVYTLTVQHQPMVRPMILTVRLTLPKDANVRALPPGWSLLNNVATYHGTVSRDFVTQLVF